MFGIEGKIASEVKDSILDNYWNGIIDNQSLLAAQSNS